MNENKEMTPVNFDQYINIKFQEEPVQEAGINGCDITHVIEVIINRLNKYQFENDKKFKCRENAIAITKLEEALLWLEARTKRRIRNGVEGTNITTDGDHGFDGKGKTNAST